MARVDLEYGVIGDFLMGNVEKMLTFAENHGLKAEHFVDNTARASFERIKERKIYDNALVQRDIEKTFGVEFALKCADRSRYQTSFVDAELRVGELAETGRKDEIKSVLSDVNRLGADTNTNSSLFAAKAIERLRPFARNSTGAIMAPPMKLSDLGETVSEEENPLGLFENGWLRKGQAAFLTSVSGSGKSVITMQFCYAWALGEEMFGIKPLRPLKIGVFQTEDDDDELRFFRDSMRYNYSTRYNWSEEKIAQAESNIDFFPMVGKMGDEFIKMLDEAQSAYNYDLVIINPFQGVTDFDIAQNDKVRDFVRGKIDPIIKNGSKPCGLFIVHHTNKPPMQKERGGYGKDSFAQYVGAGGAEINNWMRAGLIIMPDVDGGFQFVAAKRGGRLKSWRKPEGRVLPTKYIKHSDSESRYPFWLEFDPIVEKQEEAAAEAKNDLAEIEKRIDDDCKLIASLITCKMPAMMLRELTEHRLGTARSRTALKYFSENLQKYGIMYKKDPVTRGKTYGTIKMFQED